ncbi:hypothetical protein DIPPA_60682 [Diplonema papillatum]|nr:hypothetical protein DIPPA_60682 [Diplonema papillatum]
MDYKATLEAFFRAYDEKNVPKAESLLTKHAGQEEALFDKLGEKYSTKFFSVAKALTLIFQKHDSSKVAQVPALLQKHAPREEAVLAKIRQTYGSSDTAAGVAASHTTPAAGRSSTASIDYKAAITTFFTIYASDKVGSVDALLGKHSGNEAQLLTALDKKFGKQFFPNREKALAIFRQHDPGKIDAVDNLFIKKLSGSTIEPEQLVQVLIKKYGDVSDPASAAPTQQLDYAGRIRAIFQKYDPAKVDRTEALLAKHPGQEAAIIAKLVSTYGPEPAPAPSSAATAAGAVRSVPKPPTAWPERIKAFYEAKDPSKAASADVLCQKYSGREQEVWKSLVAKFGPEEYWLQRVTRLLQAHKPEAAGNAEKLLKQHAGNEEQLVQSLVSKFGAEPPEPTGGATGTPAVNTMTARAKVIRFYYYKAPEKVATAIAHVSPGGNHHGKEDAMYEALIKKFGGDPSPPDPPKATDYKARFVNMYAMYCPEKISTVDALLERVAGNEGAAVTQLVAKYGAEPAVASSSGVPQQRQLTHQERVIALFKKYCPDKLERANDLLVKHKGNEENLIASLVTKLGPEPPPPSGATKAPKTWRERLEAFYKHYNPEKLHTVEALLSRHKGREADVLESLIAKYGPEPEDDDDEEMIDTFEKRLVRFYKKYNPEKVQSVPSILDTCKGREAELFASLVEKYGPEPEAPAEDEDPRKIEAARRKQEKRDTKDWAKLTQPLRLLHEGERAARWDVVDEWRTELVALREAEKKHITLVEKAGDINEMADRSDNAVRRQFYKLWLQRLKDRIREEKRRHRELLDQRMSVYDQIATNKYSILYYSRQAKLRKVEQEKRQRKFETVPSLHVPPTRSITPQKDFVAHNARMASISGQRTVSPCHETHHKERRIPETISPQALQKVLSYQRKWLPTEFSPPEYPTRMPDGTRVSPPRHNERRFAKRVSAPSLEARHQDRVSKAAQRVETGYPEADSFLFSKTLQNMTGTSETALERAMKQMHEEQTSRQLAESQRVWNSMMDSYQEPDNSVLSMGHEYDHRHTGAGVQGNPPFSYNPSYSPD